MDHQKQLPGPVDQARLANELTPDVGILLSRPSLRSLAKPELDMTPMVDVTFLLLIFFMVTASFAMQSAIRQSAASAPPTISARTIDDDLVEVMIDQNDHWYVADQNAVWVETPNEATLRAQLQHAIRDTDAQGILLTAHVDSTHARVVKVWDAGLSAGLDHFRLRTTELDY